MTKQEFFKILKEGLNDFPENELNNILEKYELYFQNGLLNGKTEEELLNNIDNPYTLVNEYRNIYSYNKHTDEYKKHSQKSTKNSTNNTVLKILIIAFSVILFGPLLISILGIILGILISLVAIPFSLLIAAIGLLIGKFGIKVIGFTIPSFLTDIPLDVTILISLGSLFATILFTLLMYYFIKFIIIWSKKHIFKKSNQEA